MPQDFTFCPKLHIYLGIPLYLDAVVILVHASAKAPAGPDRYGHHSDIPLRTFAFLPFDFNPL
jgi:hypothetical protein